MCKSPYVCWLLRHTCPDVFAAAGLSISPAVVESNFSPWFNYWNTWHDASANKIAWYQLQPVIYPTASKNNCHQRLDVEFTSGSCTVQPQAVTAGHHRNQQLSFLAKGSLITDSERTAPFFFFFTNHWPAHYSNLKDLQWFHATILSCFKICKQLLLWNSYSSRLLNLWKQLYDLKEVS